MGVIEDLRKLIQDLVTPDLKALEAKLERVDVTSKMRDDALAASLASKVELILGRMDAQHATVMNGLDLNKRMTTLERQVKAPESATV